MEGNQTEKDVSTAQVQIQLATNDASIKLPDGIGSILVSTSFKRYALSTLVNNLLENEKPIPFEFLVNGRYLRTSIEDFLNASGVSAEDTLSLEYIRASIPPTYVTSFEHDDCIAAIDVLSSTSPAGIWASKEGQISPGNERIIAAGYDGVLKVWSPNSEVVAVSSPVSDHRSIPQAIKTTKFISPSEIVTGGNDRIIRVWNFLDIGGHSKLDPVLELFGHQSSVDSIAVHAPSSHILSGSSDHTVALWSHRSTDGPNASEALLSTSTSIKQNKRRKPTNSAAFLTTEVVPQKGPLSIFTAHTRPVTAVIFDALDRTVGYSSSWDQTISTWDLTTGQLVSSRRTLHPLLSLMHMPELKLLSVGTSARHITMVDPRTDAKEISGLTLRGHTAPIVSMACETGNPWGLVSASYDGTCRVWDLRSVKLDASNSRSANGSTPQICESLFVIKRENSDKHLDSIDGHKLFGVCWDKQIGIVSAGEDRRIQVNQKI